MTISRLNAAVVADFPQLAADRTICVPGDNGSGIVIAEFLGDRVDDIRALRKNLSTACGMHVSMVRQGWLPLHADGAVDVEAAIRKMADVRVQQQHVKSIEDGSFSVLPESSKDCFRYFGTHSKIRTPLEMTYPSHVTVGNWVSLGRYGKIVMLPGEAFQQHGEDYVSQHYPSLVGSFDFSHSAEGRPAKLYFGDGTTLGDRFFIICTKAVQFGQHVMTAPNLFVSDCHHIYEGSEIPPALLPVTAGKPVTIEDHVWIGINCCILEGVTVGRHAVVAANSVVKEDVPPYSLVAGAPARVKKTFRPGESRTF